MTNDSRGAYHPWRALRHMEHVQVSWVDLPAPFVAITDGSTVWMHDKLLQTERRCAIAHELVHIERGTRCVDDAEERRVRTITAQRLVTVSALVEALRWSSSIDEAADELWVTPEVLRDRLADLSTVERAQVDQAISSAWHQDGR